MTAASLSISRLVNVDVNLAPNAAQIQNINTLMLLGTSDIIDTTERYRSYDSVSAIASDFGTSAEEYSAAVKWFSQSPQPNQLYIGRWAKTATAGRLIGATLSTAEQAIALWTAVTTPKFNITIDGGSPTDVSVGSFASETNLNGVAALIQTALDALVSGTTCVWDAVYERFVIKSGTTGASSSISFLSAPATGTDISAMLGMTSGSSGAYVVDGIAAETALEAATLFDTNYGQKWYAMCIPSGVNADHVAVGTFLESTTSKHTYWANTQEAGVLVSASTTDLAYLMKAANLNRSFVQYSSNHADAVVSACAKALTINYNGNNTVIDLMYKQEPVITAETLNYTQLTNLLAKNANVFVAYNNDTAILEPGDDTNGIPMDIITGIDWLALTLQTELYNALYLSATKIPQTDAGNHILVNVMEAVLSQAVVNGLLAPGTWTAGGFGAIETGDFLPKGFYVYAPPISSQLPADRSARRSVAFQIAAKLAGAIRYIDLTINVNR